MRRIHKVLLFSLALFLQGCFVYGKKDMLSIDSVVKQKEPLKSSLSSVNVSNNQITINGSGFSKVTSVTIKGSGVEQALSINSKSDSQIVALATNTLSLLVGGTFDLIIGTVDAQATYAVTFTLQNGAIEASHLSSMGASSGQILKYNGSSWIPTSQIDAQIYMGTWDATTTIPDVTLSSAGDYYIVSVAGGGYAVGDWIISDGYDWTKVAYSKTSVSSFNGRKGIVTLTAADYLGLKDGTTHKITGSSLNDIADVDLTGAATGNFLKYDGTNWVPASAVGGGSIGSADIATGVIDNSHVSATAAIAQSKIADLATDLGAKQNTSSLAADVKAVTLTGLTSNTGNVAATDTIFDAFRKLMNVSGDYVSASAGASIVTGTIAVSGTGMITVPLASGTTSTEVANITYVGNAIAANGVWTKNVNGVDIGYTAGKVGIGTTAPSAKLHVIGSSILGDTTTPANGARVLQVYTGHTSSANSGIDITRGPQATYGTAMSQLSLRIKSDGGGSYRGAIGFADSDTPAETMTFLNSGNIGILTAAPTNLLSFGGNSARTVWMERHTTANTAGNNLTMQAGGATSAATDKNGGGLILSGGTATGTGTSTISFQTATAQGSTNTTDNAPTTKMTILGNGNVGIGTTTPSELLSISGTGGAGRLAKIVQTATSISNNSYTFEINSSSHVTNVSAAGAMAVDVNSGRAFTINGLGNVGIGTTSPTSLISLSGTAARTIAMERNTTAATAGLGLTLSSGGAIAGTADLAGGDLILKSGISTGTGSSSIHFYTATAGTTATTDRTPTEKMTILGSGSVGIGTTSPFSLLANSSSNITSAVGGTGLASASLAWQTNVGGYVAGFENLATGTAKNGILIKSASTAVDAYLLNVESGGSNRLTVRGDGNVGIGTTSPASKLTISASSSSITAGALSSQYSITSTSGSNGVAAFQALANPSGTSAANVYGIHGEAGTYSGNAQNLTAVIGAAGLGASVVHRGTGTVTGVASLYAGGLANTGGGTVTNAYGLYLSGMSGATNNYAIYANGSTPSYFGGNVGIGTTSPGYKLDVAGDMNTSTALRIAGTSICTSGGCTSSSDKNLKENIKPLSSATDNILKLQGVNYDWKDKKKYNDKHQIGLIAQDVEKVYPEVVVTDSKTGLKSLAYDHLIAPVIEAFKELNKRFTGLYSEFKALVARVMNLEEKDKAKDRAIASVKVDIDAKTAKLAEKARKLEAENKEIKAKLEKIEKLLEKIK